METITNQEELENAFELLNELNLEATPTKTQIAMIKELENDIFVYQSDCTLFELGKDYTLDDIIYGLSDRSVDGVDNRGYRYSLPEGYDNENTAEVEHPAFETLLLFQSELESCLSVLVFLKINDQDNTYRLIAKDIDNGIGGVSMLGDEPGKGDFCPCCGDIMKDKHAC